MTKRTIFTTQQVAVILGLTYGALRSRMSHGSITPPHDMIDDEMVIRRQPNKHNLIWYAKDVKQAKTDLKRSKHG